MSILYRAIGLEDVDGLVYQRLLLGVLGQNVHQGVLVLLLGCQVQGVDHHKSQFAFVNVLPVVSFALDIGRVASLQVEQVVLDLERDAQ